MSLSHTFVLWALMAQLAPEPPGATPSTSPSSPAPGELEPPPPPEAPPSQTVVTSTRSVRRLQDEPRAVSVTSQEALRRRAPRTTPEALAEEAGVYVQKTSPAGGAPIMRGLLGQQVLLLVDGVRLNNATVRAGPNQFLNLVDPFLVEKLEVVRGPGSVLYGSDALGGVVNVLTAEPRFSREPTPKARARLIGGSADRSLQGSVELGLSLQHTAVLGSVSGRSFGDLQGGAEAGLQRYTGYEERGAALKVRQRLAPGTLLSLQYQATRQEDAPRTDRSRPGDFRTFANTRDLLHARLERTGLGPLTRARVDASAHSVGERVDRYQSSSRDRFDRERVDNWTFGLRAEGEATPELGPLGRLTTLFGAEAFHDRVSSQAQRGSVLDLQRLTDRPELDRYAGAPTATSAALFGLLSSDPAAGFSYRAGVRAQLNDTRLPEDSRLAQVFATATNPPPVLPASVERAFGWAAEAGVQQRIHPAVTLAANLGTGFRAPNVDDYLRLGAEGPGFTTPSRGLHPEQSYTAELGARLSGERLQGQLFYAYTVIDGLIASVPTEIAGEARAPDGLRYLTRRNTETAWVHAVEAAVSYRPLPQLALGAQGTYTHSTQRRQDLLAPGEPLIEEPLSKSPPTHGLVRVSYEPLGFLFVEGAMRWALAQRRLSQNDLGDIRICPESPDCQGTPGYAAFFLRGGARLSERASVSLSLQNLTHRTYRIHGSGVDEPGLSGVLLLEGSL